MNWKVFAVVWLSVLGLLVGWIITVTREPPPTPEPPSGTTYYVITSSVIIDGHQADRTWDERLTLATCLTTVRAMNQAYLSAKPPVVGFATCRPVK